MNHNINSIRPFIGSKDFNLSRAFYKDLGFSEKILFPEMSYFGHGGFGFYLQNYYVKDWLDNTVIFLEVDDAHRYFTQLEALDLPSRYGGARLIPVRRADWGNECFLHDPSGALWHFGSFKKE